jgi:hypothetical protein
MVLYATQPKTLSPADPCNKVWFKERDHCRAAMGLENATNATDATHCARSFVLGDKLVGGDVIIADVS